MSRVYKSAKGKMVDMDKVKLANETSIAVGNMKVNARGDLLSTGGQVATGRNAVMDQVYAVNSVPPPPPYNPGDPTNQFSQESIMAANKAKELHDLATNLVQSSNPETVQESDVELTDAPVTRGSLASSVAKTVSVNQQPLPNPKKPTGPSRI
jgi:hypothetical protein